MKNLIWTNVEQSKEVVNRHITTLAPVWDTCCSVYDGQRKQSQMHTDYFNHKETKNIWYLNHKVIKNNHDGSVYVSIERKPLGKKDKRWVN